MGDFGGALKDFDTVIEQNPQNIRALCERADAYRLSGSWSKAIEDYEILLGLVPAHSHAAFWLGVLHLDTGRSEKAVAMLEKAIALGYRESGEAYFLLGKAYQKLGRVERASEALRRSHEMGDTRAMAELRKIEGK
jgi:tetratricopeptide (TPR) repeat protein